MVPRHPLCRSETPHNDTPGRQTIIYKGERKLAGNSEAGQTPHFLISWRFSKIVQRER
jgi:hypothetical protein